MKEEFNLSKKEPVEVKVLNEKCVLILRCDTVQDLKNVKKTIKFLAKNGWFKLAGEKLV